MTNKFSYKSMCWKFGTTSFRTKNFNKTIEEQLKLLDEFWRLPENKKLSWTANNELQAKYYDFMLEKNFLFGNANNKSKDAREKTSGLVDIGLIDEERKLSAVGKLLLKFSKENDFNSDNELQLPRDSYLYLKQLLKTSYSLNGNTIRPFIILLAAIVEFKYLTYEEFTYLLPLCIGQNEYKLITDGIKKLRDGKCGIDEIIIDHFMEMKNYQAALAYFLANDVSIDVICDVAINRKSRNYDVPYYDLYKALYAVFLNHDDAKIYSLREVTGKLATGAWWREYLFDTANKKAIKKEPRKHLKATVFDDIADEISFKKVFFEYMHLFKAKATLADYADLNRRYAKTADVLLFEDNEVKLDIVPHYFFSSVMSQLKKIAFSVETRLGDNIALSEISPCLVVDEKIIIAAINKEIGISVTNLEDAKGILENNRYKRFERLIDTVFTDENIMSLLEMFASRNDREIQKFINAEADIPTIFEYVLGILWYKISERKGKILDYMKLSLDADLLPKTHAAGGEADIVYEYQATSDYPKHTLLLEATLSESTTQRHMEMEPVSRHLGQHLVTSDNKNDYCVFITNKLNINVIADFRGRKNTVYYDDKNDENFVEGMKIIPLEINELKKIIQSKLTYGKLYTIFSTAYKSNLLPREWYSKMISDAIKI